VLQRTFFPLGPRAQHSTFSPASDTFHSNFNCFLTRSPTFFALAQFCRSFRLQCDLIHSSFSLAPLTHRVTTPRLSIPHIQCSFFSDPGPVGHFAGPFPRFAFRLFPNALNGRCSRLFSMSPLSLFTACAPLSSSPFYLIFNFDFRNFFPQTRLHLLHPEGGACLPLSESFFRIILL